MLIDSNPTAFDAFATGYDDAFTNSTLGQFLRPRVWDKLKEYFIAGQHVLELACGTGEDAVWLAQQGICVTATDGSAEMVRVARVKAEAMREEAAKQPSSQAARIAGVDVQQVSLQEIIAGHRSLVTSQPFDGVYSNFGGLNTIGDWRSLAEALAKIIRPGGIVILVPMGPFCPWEIGWYLGHGQLKEAFRRFGRKASAKIGESIIPIWYPSAKRLRTDFSPWFQHRHTESLELWLPPSYLDHLVNRWPGVFYKLNQFEKATAHLTKGWGDHYIMIFERKNNLKNET